MPPENLATAPEHIAAAWDVFDHEQMSYNYQGTAALREDILWAMAASAGEVGEYPHLREVGVVALSIGQKISDLFPISENRHFRCRSTPLAYMFG